MVPGTYTIHMHAYIMCVHTQHIYVYTCVHTYFKTKNFAKYTEKQILEENFVLMIEI